MTANFGCIAKLTDRVEALAFKVEPGLKRGAFVTLKQVFAASSAI